MPLPEDIEQSTSTYDAVTYTTDDVAEAMHDTDALVGSVQTTEELEVLPRISELRSRGRRRRQDFLRQKQTALLPQASLSTSTVWCRIKRLRAENKRLHDELHIQRRQVQQLTENSATLQAVFDQEVATIHAGHSQDIEHYQTHFHALLEEHNRLCELHTHLEHNYQTLYHTFQDVVEEELRKRLTEATYTLQNSPETIPPFLQELVRVVEALSRSAGERHLIEALFLKREVQMLAEQLQAERQQLATERQHLLALQQSAREQAQLRQRTLRARLQARWKVASLSTALGLLALLVVLQFVFLYILHVSLIAPVSVSLFAPIVLCILLVLAFSQPVSMMKYMYMSAPHKRKAKKEH